MALNAEKYLLVSISFKQKVSPYDVISLYFSDRAAPAGSLFTDSPEFFPLLVSVSGIGSEMGEVLPKNKTGSVVLSNAKGAIRYDLAVADLLSDYSIVDQPITIVTFEKPIDAIGDAGDIVTEFDGYVSDVAINHSNDTISFSTYDSFGGTEVLNAIISSDLWPSADSRSLNRPVPIIFGEGVEVPALNIKQESTKFTFGYGSTIGSPEFPNGGVSSYLAKTERGDFGQVASESDSNYFIFGQAATAGDIADIWAYQEMAWKITSRSGASNQLPIDGRIITGGRFYAVYGASITLSDYTGGTFIFRIYASLSKTQITSGKKNSPDDSVVIAEAEVFQEDATASGTISTANAGTKSLFYWDFVFNKPAVLVDGRDYFFSIAANKGEANNQFLPLTVADSPFSMWGRGRYFNVGEPNKEWHKLISAPPPNSGTRMRWRLYAAKITDVPTPGSYDTTTNRGISAFEVSVNTSSGQTTESLIDLNMLAVCSGIKDSSTGTVTGTNNKQIVTASDIAKFLNYINGTGKTISTSDYTQGSTSTIAGFFENVTTVKDALSEVLFNAAARLVPKRDGDYSYYRYGSTKIGTAKIITEADAQLLKLDIGDKATIINSAYIFYGRKSRPLNLEDVQQGAQNYQGSRSISYGSGGIWAELLTDSYNVYGSRFLGDRGTFLNLLKNEADALYLLEMIFRQYAMESWTVDFLLPYWAKDYKEIENNSVIRFKHQKNLHIHGTDSPITAQKPLPGIAFNFGQVWARAKTYPLRILSREVEYPIAGGEPYLKLKAKVLNNKNEIY